MSTIRKKLFLLFVATCAACSATMIPMQPKPISYPTARNINIPEEKNEEVKIAEIPEIIEMEEVKLEQVPVEDEPILDLGTYYDVPLSYELQDYIRDLCNERGLQMELVLSLIEIESEFKPNAISKTNDYGLMQINKSNHSMLRKKYGVTDFLDPKQNILCGVEMLSELHEKHKNTHKALMAYNMGEGNARKHWNNGTVTSRYSRKVVERMGKYMCKKETNYGI